MARDDDKKKHFGQPEKRAGLPFPGADRKVLMVFTEDQFYNDLQVPKYVKNKVHEITEERPGYIDRWIPYGGIILTPKEAEEYNKKKEVIPASAPDATIQKPEILPLGNADLENKPIVPNDEPEENEIEL